MRLWKKDPTESPTLLSSLSFRGVGLLCVESEPQLQIPMPSPLIPMAAPLKLELDMNLTLAVQAAGPCVRCTALQLGRPIVVSAANHSRGYLLGQLAEPDAFPLPSSGALCHTLNGRLCLPVPQQPAAAPSQLLSGFLSRKSQERNAWDKVRQD